MSMTRAEAIEVLENGFWWEMLIPVTTIEGRDAEDKLHDALDLALSALRGPTREMVERMRGRWVNLEGEEVEVDKYGCPVGFASCSVCDDYLSASEEYSCRGQFCPNCGAPMTDEAVDMMPERWKEAVDGEAD